MDAITLQDVIDFRLVPRMTPADWQSIPSPLSFSSEPETTTYEDYLASVTAQKERDRDRFLGIDSHNDQPTYSAETGWGRDQPTFHYSDVSVAVSTSVSEWSIKLDDVPEEWTHIANGPLNIRAKRDPNTGNVTVGEMWLTAS